MKNKSQYKNARSWNMSRIRSKDTKPELMLRKALYAEGIRYRKNYRKLPGSPDITITKYQIAIFVDGEFWHGHNWENRRKELKTNRQYWINKIENNMNRDIKNDALLRQLGWIPLHFWEKDINNDLYLCIETVFDFIMLQDDRKNNYPQFL